MSRGEIDKFPVSQLPSRYDLARSAVYKRMDQLGIVPERVGNRAFLNVAQVKLMDDLHAFINHQGGSAAEFIEARGLRQPRTSPGNAGGSAANGSTLAPTPGDFGSLISAIVSEVVSRLGGAPAPDPMHYFDRLEAAARNGWMPSTSELAELLDLSPRDIERLGDSFFEAGFIFTRAGYRKNGEVAWRVTKRSR
ncbi:hypothetical protein [Nodosilinea sp. P-1105]|uniref:hypothetical protein n=1 Tax=Nodosilinea sp. P-1105 TaxID=2546229 RepID=UPI00146CE279|nr:hypothetical protein [Nodosilinea sp. P-1105]NMF82053.1 hypothetical protein [Nodosilinea sp. P-1105]